MKHVGIHVELLTGRPSKYGRKEEVVAAQSEQHPATVGGGDPPLWLGTSEILNIGTTNVRLGAPLLMVKGGAA